MKEDTEHDGRMNVFAKIAIPRQYTDAAEIIERKGGTSCSVELAVNELSWDSNEKTLLLNDITVMGLTLLGKDPNTGNDVAPGMENAHVQLEDFSVENNSLTFNSNIINEIADAVVSKLSNAKNQRKEDDEVVDFEEKIEETTVEEMEVESTEEAVTEEMSEETAEETPEVVETEENRDESATDEADDSTEDTETFDGDSTEANDADPADDDQDGADEESDAEDEVDDTDDGVLNNGQQGKRSFSINGMNFEVSLSEIQFSLYELVNNTYSESDNDYYSVEVYEGSKTVVMSGLFSGRSYKQGYKVRNNVYSLVGDRISVKPVFVTADEEAELDRMRSNYSSIEEKLQKYESEPEKMEILNSSDYANIADQADFAELKKQENHFNLTVDELKEKADAMLLQYAKSGKLNFAAIEQKEKKEEPKKDFFAFARVEHNSSFLDGLLKNRR